MALLNEARTYVAGRWVTGEETLAVENPADETHVADVTVTPLAEVERAIVEARRSFDEGVWADLPATERARVLHAFIAEVEAQKDALVATMMAEAGQVRMYADFAQLGSGVAQGRGYIDLYQSMRHEEASPVPVDELVRGRVALSLRRHEPVGVVAAITPYNGAIIMAFQKLIPALIAGNSVILRPSPLTPLSSLVFGAAADAAGLPPGVLSVIVEEGAAGAELLTTHPAVDMVSFTGSTAVGRQILAQAAPTVKRVALELGGKSAQIYLDDAIAKTPMGAMQVVAMTAGQACVAATRMLVPNDRKAEVLEKVAQSYGQLKVGSPQDATCMVGPLINAAARARCEHIVALAEAQGAKVVFDFSSYIGPFCNTGIMVLNDTITSQPKIIQALCNGFEKGSARPTATRRLPSRSPARNFRSFPPPSSTARSIPN